MRVAAVLMSILAGVCAYAEPEIKEWVVVEKDSEGKDVEVTYMTIDGVLVHETDPAQQPQPPIVAPGTESTQERAGTAPSDAVVLFGGTDLSQWVDSEGAAPRWVIEEGAMLPLKDAGYVKTRQEFGSCQLHLEWVTPTRVEGEGQGRGNSGVFLMGEYEVQILDSYENVTYPDGQAAALYGRSEPLVNASRRPGEWQTFDIVFHRPVFDESGNVVLKATFTVLHNGVLVQDHVELSGGTWWNGPHAVQPYKPHGENGPIMLQDHGNPVRFRNIWVRELQD